MTDSLRPAWQTDELEDEWVELDEDNLTSSSQGTRSVSFTEPLGGNVHITPSNGGGNSDNDESPPSTADGRGTFLVRQDMPAVPLLPKTPGNRKKGMIKDFFSPLPLERMFEPPSPPISQSSSLPPAQTALPAVPSRLSQAYTAAGFQAEAAAATAEEGDESGREKMTQDDTNRSSDLAENGREGQFTFAVPRRAPQGLLTPGDFPQAESTPGVPMAGGKGNTAIHPPPMTDPRLRLFQFQYDTFTRDHLSAIVDSIAVNTPSGGSSGTTVTVSPGSIGLSRISEITGANTSHLRSAKRVKLSPASDYYGEGDGAGAIIARPKIFIKDYVGESRSLMQQIKQARDFSTISTAASARSFVDHANSPEDKDKVGSAAPPSFLGVPENRSGSSSIANASDGSKRGAYSSLAIRQQAADLMAQIKNDMKGPKRLFSDATEISHVTIRTDEKSKSSHRRSPPPESDISSLTTTTTGAAVAAKAGTAHPVDRENHNKEQQSRRHRLASVKLPGPHVSPSRRSTSRNRSSKGISIGVGTLRGSPPRRLDSRQARARNEVDQQLAAEVSNMSIDDEPWQQQLQQLQLHVNGNGNGNIDDVDADDRPKQALLAPPVISNTNTNTNTHTDTKNSTKNSTNANTAGGARSYPSTSIRSSANNEDLNRFVSSSTASGTTLTASSAPSFVKHAGPVLITRIAPEDVPALPDRVGKMVFDRGMMKWVKATAGAAGREERGARGGAYALEEADQRELTGGTDGESEDPFRDIESLREDDSRQAGSVRGRVGTGKNNDEDEEGEEEEEEEENAAAALNMTVIDEADEEEMELTSFSFDAPSAVRGGRGVAGELGFDLGDDSEDVQDDVTTDSDDEGEGEGAGGDGALQEHVDVDGDSFTDDEHVPPEPRTRTTAQTAPAFSTPHRTGGPTTPVIRSVLKSTSAMPTPVSALKDASRSSFGGGGGGGVGGGGGGWSLNRRSYHQNRDQSVDGYASEYETGNGNGNGSKSGNRDGNYEKQDRHPDRDGDQDENANANTNADQTENAQTPAKSSRGHRRSVSFSDGKRDGPILGIGRNAHGRGGEDASVGVGSGSGFVPSARSKRIADLMDGLEGGASGSSGEDESISRTSKSKNTRKGKGGKGMKRQGSEGGGGITSRRVFSRTPALAPVAHTTFLTECSFGVAHDRLVQVITDVQPFEPHWEELGAIDLSGKGVESVARMEEFLPQLGVVNLNENQLAWLSGVPKSVRTLSVASNVITSMTSFGHLLNLECLDVSRNEIDSLRQLACLRRLRELRADDNSIESIEGLEGLDGLVKLSLEGNKIRRVDLEECRWTRLETLNLSKNGMERIEGVSLLSSLVVLNADHNRLEEIGSGCNMMKRLRVLRVSGNRLREVRVGVFPNLRTLYADDNVLGRLEGVERLTKLENLSLRNQGGGGLELRMREVRDVKRMYLSGNALQVGFMTEACYNLVYLELAGCRLSSLPRGLDKLIPNVRVLNLNYNFLEDVRGLEGLKRMKKLTVIGSKLRGIKELVRIVGGMPDVEMIDFRMNPCTLGWYLPVVVPGEGGKDGWQEMDCKFRRDMPDETYVGRLAYRGLVMERCRGLVVLDGVLVSEKERRKAIELLGMMNK